MIRNNIYIVFLALVFITGDVVAQQQPVKQTKFILYAGWGPNHYLNNLVIAKDNVNEISYAFVARFMWEPEYFLSIGFETGYNRLYKAEGTTVTAGDVKIVNAIIPLQGVLTMKFLKHFYGSFTLGQSILLNKVESDLRGKEHSSSFSMSDFGIAAGYRKPLNTRWYLGAELKGYYSSKLEDKNIGLVFMTGYRF